MQQIQNKQFSIFTQEFMEIPPIVDQLDFLQQNKNQNIYLFVDSKYEGIDKFLHVKCKQNAQIKELKNIIQLQLNDINIEKMVLTFRNINCLDQNNLEHYSLNNYDRLSLSKEEEHPSEQIQITFECPQKKKKIVIECDQNMKIYNLRKFIIEQLKLEKDQSIQLIFQNQDLIILYGQKYSVITLTFLEFCGCFPSYAPITLKDCTIKIISDVSINDELVSFDDKLNKFSINKVISIKVGKGKHFISIQTQNNKIVCTPNHPFYTQDGWKAYKPNPDFNFQELNIQGKLLDINHQYQQILSIEEQLNEDQLIYNLTTNRPNTYIAFGFVVHNMDILELELPNGKKVSLEISQNMIIQQIKILINKQFNIPVERQQLYYNDMLLNDYKSLLDYKVLNSSGYFDTVKLVDVNSKPQKKNQQLPDNILQFKLVSSDYQYSMGFNNNSTIQDLKNYIFFLEKNGQAVLIYKGQFLNDELDWNQITMLDNKSTILILNPQSGASCLKFMTEIGSLFIQDVQKIIESLHFMKQDQIHKINYFIETQIKKINQDKLKVEIYQKYQLHELIAIKIYSSNIVYRDINIDIRTNQYSKCRPFLKCLINSIRKCDYYQGLAYRGVRNYQDLDYYSEGKKIQWSQISSMTKKSSVCEKFSNQKGTQFYINLISAKDISQLSIYPSEEEIVMLPFSQFEVEEVQVQQDSAVKVNLRELPIPRQANVILWVDDQPQNNYKYAYQLEQDNLNVSVVFCTSTLDAIKVVKQYKWMIYLEGSNFRIVTDMVRNENGKLNYLAGIDLLTYLFKEIDYKNEVMVFCGDVKKAKENCKGQKIIGSYKISNNQMELMRFIRFQ